MRWALVITLASALPLAEAAPVPKHLMKEPYWPTAVGTKWVYERNGFTIIEEITKAEPIKDGVRVTIKVSGPDVWDDTYDIGPAGVTHHTCLKWTIDAKLLQFPIKAGDTWAFSVPVQKGYKCDTGSVTVGGTEEIQVPAGKFLATKAVTVVTEVDGVRLDKPVVYTNWYADGVGLVKREWEGGGGTVLKSFTPGKK